MLVQRGSIIFSKRTLVDMHWGLTSRNLVDGCLRRCSIGADKLPCFRTACLEIVLARMALKDVDADIFAV